MTKNTQNPISLTDITNQIKEGRIGEYCEISNLIIVNINSPGTNKKAFGQFFEALANSKIITRLKIGADITNLEVFEAILKALEKNTSVTELDISGNQLIKDFKPLVSLLKINKNITALNISDTHVVFSTLEEIFKNNNQIEEVKRTLEFDMDRSSANILGKISSQDDHLIEEYLEKNQTGKSIPFLKSVNYPDIRIEGYNLPQALTQIVMQYLVYFNDKVAKEFPIADKSSESKDPKNILNQENVLQKPNSTLNNAEAIPVMAKVTEKSQK